MSEVTKCLLKLTENRITDIHTSIPCKVESFNSSTNTAKVTPLFKVKFANDDVAQQRPPLINVPCLKRKIKINNVITIETPFFEAGDIVLVVFLERAFDSVKNGQINDPYYSRKHALEDGVIVGLL